MSWMDSWSRPSKSQPTPPPYYLTNPTTAKYCHTCGRIISSRRTHKTTSTRSANNKTSSTIATKDEATPTTPTTTEPKYCSSKCRSHKPRTLDRRLEAAFLALLTADTTDSSSSEPTFESQPIPSTILAMRLKPKAKGEPRIVVPCSAVETLVFGSRFDPSKVFGRRKNRASRVITSSSLGDSAEKKEEEWKPVDMDPDFDATYRRNLNRDREEELSEYSSDTSSPPPTAFAGTPRPPQHLSSVNGSIGGEKGRAERVGEDAEGERRRLEGQRVAEEREMVKRAGRRGCVFGFEGEQGQGRLCEAVMVGNNHGVSVVEPSFAKGDWGVRWREG